MDGRLCFLKRIKKILVGVKEFLYYIYKRRPRKELVSMQEVEDSLTDFERSLHDYLPKLRKEACSTDRLGAHVEMLEKGLRIVRRRVRKHRSRVRSWKEDSNEFSGCYGGGLRQCYRGH